MAATIVAFVCEDHQDYELMEPSTTIHNRKSEKEKTVFSPLTKLISTYLKHSQTLFHTHTGSKCAKVLLSQDIL